MYNALTLFALILSVAACVLIQHVLIRFNRVEKSYQNWAQSLSDDCNSAIDCRYHLMLDAAKKDILAFFQEYDEKLKNNDIEYVEITETPVTFREDVPGTSDGTC